MNATLAVASSQPPAARRFDDSDTDSDDSDVAFASMDFSGVDFGGDDDADNANFDAGVESFSSGVPRTNNSGTSLQAIRDEGGDGIDAEVPSAITNEPSDDVIPITHSQTPDSLPTPFNPAAANALSSIIFSDTSISVSDIDKNILAIERDELLPRSDEDATDFSSSNLCDVIVELEEVNALFALLKNGKYADILSSEIAMQLFGKNTANCDSTKQSIITGELTMMEQIKRNILLYFAEDTTQHSKSAIIKCVEVEIIGVASLNLFLQLNYSGPSMDRELKPEEGKEMRHPLDGINPHGIFEALNTEVDADDKGNTTPVVSTSVPPSLISEDGTQTTRVKEEGIHSLKLTNTDAFHNAVLSELAIDGEWPFQICTAPYFLLLARAILSTLVDPNRPFRMWCEKKNSSDNHNTVVDTMAGLGISSTSGADFAAAAKLLSSAILWSARAIVAHRRLISTRRDDDDGQACPTLWNEAEAIFTRCLSTFCDNQVILGNNEQRNTHVASEVMLEWGLAQHHFRKLGRGKASFDKALEIAKLKVEVTGAEGKRTKYQQKATAQYLVRAKPSSQNASIKSESKPSKENAHIEKQMIKHDDVSSDAILLEKVNYEDQDDNVHYNLSILDQSILLALCLDVKNDNPMDGLTGEQMGGYLARVLNQHDDWMVYATALLERAWLECERTHSRERAILQIQALTDQHSNRLTLTQSTFKSVEEDSAPAQDRLRHLHGIVYPPRWDMLRDLAERYARLGVVTSAAEIFEELELWDDVVECYRIAGKQSKAEEVVRTRLAEKATPRMYAVLGDLTNDPKCFERSLELSNGKFYDAHVALGKYYFGRGDLRQALTHFLEGLEIKPLMPAVWFRVGTISMQLAEWDTALRAFTEVVMQEPEEGDAWANVAAIHMHRKNPEEAYPALIESLKQNRNNWRVWVSKLYTCIDLKKYDEAIQACIELLNLKARKHSSDSIPLPEEKCIRAIVGGSLRNYGDARASGDLAALDSANRTLSRVKELLERLKSTIKPETWLYEVSAFFNEETGTRKEVLNDLMKEYRTLQSCFWAKDPVKVTQMTNLVKGISFHHKAEGKKENLVKCKLLIKGAMKKMHSIPSDSKPLPEIEDLEALLSDLETSFTQ